MLTLLFRNNSPRIWRGACINTLELGGTLSTTTTCSRPPAALAAHRHRSTPSPRPSPSPSAAAAYEACLVEAQRLGRLALDVPGEAVAQPVQGSLRPQKIDLDARHADGDDVRSPSCASSTRASTRPPAANTRSVLIMVNTSMRLTEPSFSALLSMRREIGSRSCAQSRVAETRLSAPPSNWFGVSCRTATPEKSRRRTPESDDDDEDVGRRRQGELRECLFELAQPVPVRVPQEQVVRIHRDPHGAKRRRHYKRRVALDDDLQALDPERFLVVERQGGVGEHEMHGFCSETSRASQSMHLRIVRSASP